MSAQAIAHSATELARVEVAAAVFMRASLPAGNVKIDPRIWSTARGLPGEHRPAARTAAMRSATGAIIAYQESSIVCGRTSISCRLDEESPIVVFGEPTVFADSATIPAAVMEPIPSKPGRPGIYFRQVILLLRRVGSGWRVIQERFQIES